MNPHFDTRAIHAGHNPYAGDGDLVPPIHLSSTYTFPSAMDGQLRFGGEQQGFVYGRLGNPTVALLEARLAALEGSEACVAMASGMGAITALFWTICSPGDHVIADKTLYGCTFSFFAEGLQRFGIDVSYADLTNPENLVSALRANTKAVYFETPSNPNMRVVDIQKIAEIAKQAGCLTIVDSTYMTPYLQRPIELGADFVVHSMTKYLCGHGDVIAGCVCGSHEWMKSVRMIGVKDMTGACLGGFEAYLVLRGLKTLSIRMERHCQNALAVAKFLQSHPRVRTVLYPGLSSDPGFDIHRKQASHGGGMIAFEVDGTAADATNVLDRMNLFVRAVSLGDAESLAQHPATMTHSTYSAEQLREHGISEGLVRISVGLEHIDDLIADLDQALDPHHHTISKAG